ncbi:MAG: ester cyclase [Flavobacteriales bacterium]|nr:ester cyclase [Flavobacteriales bacterium]
MLKHLLLGFPLAMLVACGGGSNPEHDKMMADHTAMLKADSAASANEAVCIACFEKIFAMFGSGDATGVEECVAADFVEHATPPPGVTSTGLQYLKDVITMTHAMFPDLKMTILSSAVVGDMAYVHYNQKGTNTGAMGPDMPATGKAIDVNGVDIVRFVDGKATEHWGYWDETKMMQQLGLAPGAPPAQ